MFTKPYKFTLDDLWQNSTKWLEVTITIPWTDFDRGGKNMDQQVMDYLKDNYLYYSHFNDLKCCNYQFDEESLHCRVMFWVTNVFLSHFARPFEQDTQSPFEDE